MKTNKNDLLKTFNNLFKGCVLYCIHLNGFSHTVFYKDENGEKHVDGYSAYDSTHNIPTKVGDGVWRSWNEDKTKVLFLGYPHHSYQGNAKEYVYKDAKEW